MVGIFVDIIEGVLDILIGLFTGDWERASSGIVAVFMGLIKGIVRLIDFYLIDPLNDILRTIKDIEILGATPFSWISEIPTLSNLMKFHQGGVVPGRPGQEVVALLQAGERVIPANKASSMGNIQITVNLYGRYDSPTQLRNHVRDGVREGIRGITRYTEGGYTI